MICKQCQNRRCQTRSREGGHSTVWKCGIDSKKLWFGYQFEYDSGKNMPAKCNDFTPPTKWS